MKFSEALQQDRRLAMLRLMVEAGGTLNESVMRDGLEQLGHSNGLTADVVREDLRFLEKVGCLRIDWFADKVMIARILRRGVDCAAGAIRVEGVKRPSLGE